MRVIYRVMSYATEESVCEGFATYADAEAYIESRQNPDDFYVGWDYVD